MELGKKEKVSGGEAIDLGKGVAPAMDSGFSLVAKVAALPFSIARGGFNALHGASTWILGGSFSTHSSEDGAGAGPGTGAAPLLPVPSPGATEAAAFIHEFELEYGCRHPSFLPTAFMDSLRKAKHEFKLLFAYLHSPDHENTPAFCQRTLCTDTLVDFIDRHFVSWGGDVRACEGFQISKGFKASTFPFCAVVLASSNQRIDLLYQVEGPVSVEDMLRGLEKVFDEQGMTLVAARIEEEERRLNRCLREEQDAAYLVSLEADREREHKRGEEVERRAREAVEAEHVRKVEEEVVARAAKEVSEREAVLDCRRQEKALALPSEPDKGPNVTEVLVRFPNGERKERRFHCDATIRSVYDYVDSLHFFGAVEYKLVSNFPRVVYGLDKFTMTLKEAGLHPRASLYVQVEDS